MYSNILRKLRSSPALLIFFGLLILAVLYCTWYANYYNSGNSDDIVYPYLFSHFRFHNILLPSQHSNVLKFPLYILQSLLPYNFATFSLVNLGLGLVTVVGWAIILVWLFGKRYAPLICLALMSVLVGSKLLNYDLVGNTARNIEYPLVLTYTLFVGSLLEKRRLSRQRLVIGIVLGILFALTIAGDSFFLYTMVSSILLILFVWWFNADKATKRKQQFGLVALYVLGCSALALIIREAVKVLGIARYFTDPGFLPHVLPLNHLGPSISTASIQLLNLFNANFFGQKIRPTHSLIFLNLMLLAIGIVGLVSILRDTVKVAERKALLSRVELPRVFTLAVAALAAFAMFVVYIVSDLVVVQTPTGVISTAYQERYLTMLPLLLVIGIAYFVWRNFEKRKLIMLGLPIIIGLCLIINMGSIRQANTKDDSLRVNQIAVAQTAQRNNIHLLITGYWYGATVRFWSHNTIMYATAGSCNIPNPPINTQLSWYKPDPAIHASALLVAHQGVDLPFSSCSADQLNSIYGKPARIIHVNSPDKPELWVYNYDIRSKLAPFIY
jgi:hypothetical protein